MKRIIPALAVILIAIFLFSFRQTQKIDLKASIDRGKTIYVAQCITCHLEQGEGIETVYPPLAKSDYLMADKKRSIQQVLYGSNREMTVNGVTYNGVMNSFDLTDDEVSDVLNYVRNSFGNKGAPVTPEEVRASRK
ncbi:MAG: cytochrome c [Cyclobacteriaceae bacterium]|jgi:mono/diheme cytochrome c family protein|nr:cytochrome c [Cyclobacteriaceae bacterium]